MQISKALAGADRKDLMRKLPKFIYDEEKALEVRIVPAFAIFKSCSLCVPACLLMCSAFQSKC